MIKKETRFIIAIISVLLVTQIGAQQDEFKRLGKSGFSFLKISPSARAAGMGDAYTAVANDITAIFYNPAGLTKLEKTQFGFNYTDWIVNSAVMSGAIAMPLGGRGILGFNLITFTPEAFEETTVAQPEGTGKMIHPGDIAIGAAYAIRLTDRLSFGFKAQFLQETIDTDMARAWAVDFSTYYQTGFRDLVIAMVMKNFGPEASYLSDRFKLPLYFNINTALSLIGTWGSPVHLSLSLESAFATDYRDRYHIGSELWIFDMLAIRGGYKFFYDTEDWTAGIGLKTHVGGRTLFVDMAYSNFDKYFNPPLRFTIGSSI